LGRKRGKVSHLKAEKKPEGGELKGDLWKQYLFWGTNEKKKRKKG